MLVPALRSRLVLRMEWDLGVRSRPEGRIIVAGLAAALWRPQPPRPPVTRTPRR